MDYRVDDYQVWLASRPTLVEDRNHPNHWFNRAADLKASAGAVWFSMGPDNAAISEALGYAPGNCMRTACKPIYFMLCGLALELIMKAVLAQRGFTPDQFKGHKFETLHQKLGLPLKRDIAKLMAFYEASLVWAGRYPIPIDATDEKLMSFYNLANEILTKPTDLGPSGIKFRVGTDELTNWTQFSKLWGSYATLFKTA